MKKSLYIISLLLVISYLVNSAPNVPKVLSDHFQLVQTWPQTFCTTQNIKCITPLPQGFTLHGLWPADLKGNTLRNCHRDLTNVTTALTNLEKDLIKAWPSIVFGKNETGFWTHEWLEHGTCAGKQPIDYFKLAIEARNKINLLNILTAANIIPNNNSYRKADIENAVKQAIGKDTYVSCKRRTNDDLLYEIYICLKGRADNYTVCPKNNHTRGCGGVKRRANIIFPAN